VIPSRMLITGGSGSLGNAILMRAEREGWDTEVTIYSRDESRQLATRERFPRARYVLGDVRDAATLEEAARDIDVIVHAAAQKRIPEAERQPITCAQTNVEGSARVVEVARRLGTRRVVGISTDKACSPINAYGFTKSLMERMFQAEALERPDGPSFALVRYGNVLASTGSVVPAFREQAESGRLRLTDPTMTRFWLTLDDAVDLVLDALAVPSGTILVPRSRASSMAVMAEAVAPSVPIEVIGNRGGEKHDEQLLNVHEAAYADSVSEGFHLRPIAGPPGSSVEEYRSDTAPQFGVSELRFILELMDAGEPVRAIAA
jgi:UDP-N-acetylglucosamine 4,6-dehydratase